MSEDATIIKRGRKYIHYSFPCPKCKRKLLDKSYRIQPNEKAPRIEGRRCPDCDQIIKLYIGVETVRYEPIDNCEECKKPLKRYVLSHTEIICYECDLKED